MIDKANEFDQFYDRVLKFLSFRPRSEKEIKDFLQRKKVKADLQEQILEKLRRQNLINDEEFTRWWIEQRTSFKPMGKRAMIMELRRKGIPNALITNYQLPMTNEVALAKKAAEKKVRLYKNLPPLELKRKLSAFLARRGFSWETIEETIDEMSKKE